MVCSKCSLDFNSQNGLSQHEKNCYLTIEVVNEIRQKYKEGNSIAELCILYKVSKNLICKIIVKIKRNISNALKIAKIKYPQKHTDQSKEKIRVARLKWMKENPNKTAWRQANLSYPESLFLKKIKENGLDKKYLIIREMSIYPYYIDFAFEYEKVAVEIDGSQHNNNDRKLRDIKKDLLLNELGWRVIRFTAKEIQTNIDNCFSILGKFIDNKTIINERVGVYHQQDVKKQQKEKINGFTKLQKDSQINQRKSIRPPLTQLLNEIKLIGYTNTGRKYGVTCNCIRKWIKMYRKHGNNFYLIITLTSPLYPLVLYSGLIST